jgi:DNA-binding NarL/FixJ family response regulator
MPPGSGRRQPTSPTWGVPPVFVRVLTAILVGTVSDARPRARVLLADDHALMRRLLRRAISAHPALEFVGEAADGAEALTLARSLTPDVIVLDLAMPELDGLQVAGELRTDLPDCAILVFSAFEAARAADAALAAGADRYLEKTAGFEAAAQAAAELALTRR